MIYALVSAVEDSCRDIRFVEVPEIRAASGFAKSASAGNY